MQSCHDVVVTTPDLERLAAHVARRRLQLNLSIKRAAAMAALGSKDTWIRVEAAKPAHPLTYDKIESALGWTVGSCREVLDGGEPSLIDPDLDGDMQYAAVPTEELEADIRQAVQDAMVAGTDLNASKIRSINEHVIETLRVRGILPANN